MQYSTYLDSPNARLMILLTRKSHCLSVAKCVSTSCLFFTNILTLWLWLHIKSSHPSHNECSEKKLISERNNTWPNPSPLACLSLVNSLHCDDLRSPENTRRTPPGPGWPRSSAAGGRPACGGWPGPRPPCPPPSPGGGWSSAPGSSASH